MGSRSFARRFVVCPAWRCFPDGVQSSEGGSETGAVLAGV